MKSSSNPTRRLDLIQLLAAVWTLGLCLTLWLPGDSMPDLGSSWFASLPRGVDKWVHGGLFFFEAVWLVQAFRRRREIRRPFLTAFVVATLLAVLTEGVQAWVPGRSREAADLAANLAGVALGVLATCRARPLMNET